MTKTQICNLALTHIGARELTDVDTDNSNEGKVLRLWYESTRDDMLRSHPWNFAMKRARLQVTYSTLSGSAVSDSSGKVAIAHTAHGLITGDKIYIKDVEGLTSINTTWFITKVNDNGFTLDDSTYSSGYSSGTGKFTKIPLFDWNFQYTAPTDMLRLISLENVQDPFSFENGKILANDETIFVRYVYQVTDTTLYPSDFTNAFSYLLASNIAQTLTGPAGEGNNYRKIYEQMIAPMVKVRDSREGRDRVRKETQYSDLVNARFGGNY